MSRKKPFYNPALEDLDLPSTLTNEDKVSENVKPCPFCGGKANIVKIPEGLNYAGLYVVGCDDDMMCLGNINHFTMIFTGEESATEAWNRRAANVAPRAEVAREIFEGIEKIGVVRKIIKDGEIIFDVTAEYNELKKKYTEGGQG